QVLATSHPAVTRITGNKLEFIFENIQLAAAEHGHVVFKIKTKSTLLQGDTVTNKADIFFDYNFPVETNLASTTFQVLGSAHFNTQHSFTLAPNPATDKLSISSGSQMTSALIYDLQGRCVLMNLIDGKEGVLDISALQKGVYTLRIETIEGNFSDKIIIE
ncbi:MAG TPA: T9SS type A sorting domain-containing protein, partial [Flavobacterium sp.]